MALATSALPADAAAATPSPRERTVYLETFGCQMNSADSDLVLARLGDHGWRRVDAVADAALVLYNTCSVRDKAEARIRGRLGMLKGEKRRRPGLVIGIM